MQAYNNLSSNAWGNTGTYNGRYNNVFSYDANGNIETRNLIERYNATTNCTGDGFVNGIVVLYSNEVIGNFLKQEGFSPIEGNPQSGDIGPYYKGKVVQHAEKYEDGGTVSSKGGGNSKTNWTGTSKYME